MILRFKETLYLQGVGETYARERRCVEHPRLSHLEQRLPDDAGGTATSNTFRVDGIANYFGSLVEALDALRGNPRADDIVSIPPWETSDEEVHGHASS